MAGLVRRVVAGALLATVAACSTDGQPEQPGAASPSDSPSSGSGESPDDSPTGSPTPATTEPVVLAVHHTRGAIRVSPRVARRVADGRVQTWRPLDGSDDSLDLVSSVRAVASDPAALAVIPASRVDASARAVVVGGVDPLRRPEAYPIQTSGREPGVVTTLTVAGDIMLDRGVEAAAPPGDPVAPLRPLGAHLAAADLTVGNLESTLSDDGTPQQQPIGDSFEVPPRVADDLARLGFDAISLANNHTGDYGDGALLDTVAILRDSRLDAFGAGRDLAAASRPVVLERKGVRFGFVGFNAIGETSQAGPGRPGALSIRMPPRTGPLNRADLAHVRRQVRRLDRDVDVVVVLPHWGEQYTHVAEPVQGVVARRLVDAGADLVAGGHPHWVQGLGRYGDAVIAHSLGNLVFDMDFMEQTMQGVTLTATFWDDDLKAVALAPYQMDAGFRPRLVRGAAADAILGDVWANSTGPFRSD